MRIKHINGRRDCSYPRTRGANMKGNGLFHKEKQLKAMKRLRENYKIKPKVKSKPESSLWFCPLCLAVNDPNKLFSCAQCVWVIETGNDCQKEMAKHWAEYTLGEEELSYNMMRNARFSRHNPALESWRKRRLRELNRWIKKYEA